MSRGRGRGRGRGGGNRGKFQNRGGARGRPNRAQNSRGKRPPGRSVDNERETEFDNDRKRAKLDDVEEQSESESEEESSSESEEEVKPYNQLLSMFKGSNRVQVVTSDEEESGEEQDASDNEEQEDAEEEGSEEESIDEEGSEQVEDEQDNEDEASEDDEPVQDDSDADNEETDLNTDTFHMHFEKEMSENVLESLTSPKPYETKELQWKALGRMVVYLPRQTEQQKSKPKAVLEDSEDEFIVAGSMPVLKSQTPLKEMGVRAQLCANLDKRPLSDGEDSTAEDLLSPLQQELFTMAHEYKDIYFPEVNLSNIDEVRTVYCLHALNHALKSRDKVLAHNAKLKKISESGGQTSDVEFRDQGLVRPRVLIVCPLRNSAVK